MGETSPPAAKLALRLLPFSILERIVMGETMLGGLLSLVVLSFSILERIVMGETSGEFYIRAQLDPFSILERIVMGETAPYYTPKWGNGKPAELFPPLRGVLLRFNGRCCPTWQNALSQTCFCVKMPEVCENWPGARKSCPLG